MWKNSWSYLTRMIFIDGTFLKSSMKGVLLVAMGMNGANHQVPLGIHYCKIENSTNWGIFISFLLKVYTDWADPNLPLIIYSDRLNGLDEIIEERLPHAVHKFCMFHISQNLKKYKPSKEVSNLVYQTSKSATEEDFEKNSDLLKIMHPKIYEYLMAIPLEKWILCYSKYPNMFYISTSPIESFNKVIVEERKKPLVDLLMGIRKMCSISLLNQKKELLMQNNNEHDVKLFKSIFDEQEVENLKRKYTTYFSTLNSKQKELSVIYHVEEFDSYYVVKYNQKTKIVTYDLKEGQIYYLCTCNYTKFMLITCRHIYAVIRSISATTDHLNNKVFSLYNWYKIISNSYTYAERPISDNSKSMYNGPDKKKKKGRPRIKRIKTVS